MGPSDEQLPTAPARRPWERPSLRPVGTVSELLGSPGGGKISITTGDSGDPLKPKGQS
jgi:hypothetical protein